MPHVHMSEALEIDRPEGLICMRERGRGARSHRHAHELEQSTVRGQLRDYATRGWGGKKKKKKLAYTTIDI